MLEDFGAHWPFLAAALVLASITQVVKKQLPTGSKAEKVLRAFLPLLPVVLGALLGLIPGMPLPLLERTLATAVLYYAFAGVASTWAFDTVKSVLRSRGVDIETLRPPPSVPQPPTMG